MLFTRLVDVHTDATFSAPVVAPIFTTKQNFSFLRKATADLNCSQIKSARDSINAALLQQVQAIESGIIEVGFEWCEGPITLDVLSVSGGGQWSAFVVDMRYFTPDSSEVFADGFVVAGASSDGFRKSAGMIDVDGQLQLIITIEPGASLTVRMGVTVAYELTLDILSELSSSCFPNYEGMIDVFNANLNVVEETECCNGC